MAIFILVAALLVIFAVPPLWRHAKSRIKAAYWRWYLRRISKW